jgi:serine-type D-Ala-D-Ala carboxypeptidase
VNRGFERPGARRASRRATAGVVGVSLAAVGMLFAIDASDRDSLTFVDADVEAEVAETVEAGPIFSADAIESLARPVADEVEAGAFPGASLAVGVGAEEIHLVGLGSVGWTRNAAPVQPEATIYDLASLTKVVATSSAVMLLVEDGRLALDDPAGRFLPDFRTGAKANVTIRHLLTHTSGVPAGAILRGNNRRERIARAESFSIYPPAGARVEYSDVGFILLGEIVERAAGESFPVYLERRLFGPLGMSSTGFSPGLDCEACAPTGRLRDQSLFRGRPFDPLAQRLDGVSGHSGLFSTAHDLARFAAMITNGGELDGVRIFRPETVQELIGPQPVGGRYRLGWEVYCEPPLQDANSRCERPLAIGHTGWTGTSLWIQPETGVWTVLLTNRTYEPRGPNRINQVRRDLFTRASAVRVQPVVDVAAPEPARSVRGGAQPGDFTPLPPAGNR